MIYFYLLPLVILSKVAAGYVLSRLYFNRCRSEWGLFTQHTHSERKKTSDASRWMIDRDDHSGWCNEHESSSMRCFSILVKVNVMFRSRWSAVCIPQLVNSISALEAEKKKNEWMKEEREKFDSITVITDSLNSSTCSQNTKERTNETNQRGGECQSDAHIFQMNPCKNIDDDMFKEDNR